MSDTLSDWRDSFFTARPILLSRLDGRALYAYRLTDSEFQTLHQALREKVKAVSSLDFLANHDDHFAGLFVLYAAEWWRREYQGGRWRWEPILDGLGIQNGWNSNQRGDCVERGLRYWRIKPAERSGHRFLGAIARQGGLPNHLLATSSGRLGRLLGEVIRLARSGNQSIDILRPWVESLKDRLPESYRQEAIFDLLAEVVATVLELVGEVPKQERGDALAWLNRNRPNWSDRFPFFMDEQSLRGLLESLILDAAARPSKESRGRPLAVERRLDSTGAEIWELRSYYDLPERITTEELKSLFQISPEDSLTRVLTMDFQAGASACEVRLERLAGHAAYRINRRPLRFSGDDAASEHLLHLTTAEGLFWSGLPRKGMELDPELPWLFTEEGSGWRLVRQGGGGIVSAQGIVAIPGGWSITGEKAERVAFLESPEREIYRIAGQVHVSCKSSERTWRIQTGDASAVEFDWQWQGQQVWEEFISPSLGFRGRPRLYDGNSVKSGVAWVLSSGSKAPAGTYGPLEAHLESHGETVFRARMVILPEAAQLEIRPQGPSKGAIRLVGWSAVGAEICGQGLHGEVRPDVEALNIEISQDEGANHSPEWVELSLVWPYNSNKAKLRFPFPGKGVRAFDGEGRELATDSWLPIQQLAGVRLVAVGIKKLDLRLVLRYPKERLNEGPGSHHTIRSQQGNSRIEIRLQDFSDALERLLSADDLLDTWVEANFTADLKSLFTLRLSRYSYPLKRLTYDVALVLGGLNHLDAAHLEKLPVLALRLEAPGDEPIMLEPCRAKGICTGAWEFLTADREPGSWFIYPGVEAKERVRPILWTVAGECVTRNPLSQAMGLNDREARAKALEEVIAAMAADYLEPCWSEVARLAGHLGHLPLVSFDLWRRFAHSVEGMAALALRLNSLPEGFVRRFSVEFPFGWELVSHRAWVKAAERLLAQCRAWFGASAARQEMEKAMDVKLDKIREECPALRNLLGILRSTALGTHCKEVEMMRSPDGERYFHDRLFGREDSALQRLLRNHAKDTWPSDNDLLRLIEESRRNGDPGVKLFEAQHKDYRDGIIDLPVALAIQVATDSTAEWFAHPERIHKLRAYRDFNPEWFDEAFDFTIARCLSLGLLKS